MSLSAEELAAFGIGSSDQVFTPAAKPVEAPPPADETLRCTPTSLQQGAVYILPDGSEGVFNCSTQGGYSFRVSTGVRILETGTPVVYVHAGSAVIPNDAPLNSKDVELPAKAKKTRKAKTVNEAMAVSEAERVASPAHQAAEAVIASINRASEEVFRAANAEREKAPPVKAEVTTNVPEQVTAEEVIARNEARLPPMVFGLATPKRLTPEILARALRAAADVLESA